MIGIFSPLPHESKGILAFLETPKKKDHLYYGYFQSIPIVVGAFGMGQRGVKRLFSSSILSNLKGILFIGCAGALQSHLSTGETFLALPSAFWDGNLVKEGSISYNREWEERVALPCLPSLTTARIISKAQEKEKLGSLGFGMVEMENYFLLQEGRKISFEKPVLFLRTILDPLDMDLPCFGENPSWRSICYHFFSSPQKMFWLALHFPRVQEKLALQTKLILESLLP